MKLGYADKTEVIVEEEQKLRLEIENLQNETVLGKVDREGLLSTVMAKNRSDVESALKDFMEQKAAQAREIGIIFLGHGGVSEGMGTMGFLEDEPVKNEWLVKEVEKYKPQNSLLGSAYSVVLSQCYSHVGIDEVRKGSSMKIVPLTTEKCEKTTTHMQFDVSWYVGGKLKDASMKSATRTQLVKWLNDTFGRNGEMRQRGDSMDVSSSEPEPMEASSQ